MPGSAENKPARPSTRRESAAGFRDREKPPSKDGTAQRRAKEVEGLKDFVRKTLRLDEQLGLD